MTDVEITSDDKVIRRSGNNRDYSFRESNSPLFNGVKPFNAKLMSSSENALKVTYG